MPDSLYPALPVMIVDDERNVLLGYDTSLKRYGINNIICYEDSRPVMDYLARSEVELILLDLVMPHLAGEQLLQEINRDYPHVPVIVITGVDEVETAVRCMQHGALDYLVKPIEKERLIGSVKRAIDLRELERENYWLKQGLLKQELEHPEAFDQIITNDEAMRAVFQYVEAIAVTSQPVLITGETGVGKDIVAQAIHRLSLRGGPLVAVNVASLDDTVFSDTLFGHVRGAFTSADQPRRGLIESSAGGTLFLDEIGELSPASQIKLLRLLQQGEYYPIGRDTPRYIEARIITSTNRDISALQESGRFRKDLYHRLRTHQIHIPPLRERMGDLPILVDHFMGLAARKLRKKKPAYPPALLDLLGSYYFPGNIRELEAMVFDAVSTHRSRMLSLESFRSHIDQESQAVQPKTTAMTSGNEAVLSFSAKLPTLKETSLLLIQEALRRTNGNLSLAARLLGISRQALSKRMKRKHASGG